MNSFLGVFNAFIFNSYHRRWLGVQRSLFIVSGCLFLAGWVWWQQWRFSNLFALIFLGLFALLLIAYRIAKRQGYARFRRDPDAVKPTGESPHMPAGKRFEIYATGIFAVENRADYALLRPTSIWRTPQGDVAIMVERAQEQFLYEFLLPGSMDKIECGHLLFGPRPLPSLALTFGSTWGPQFSDHDRTHVAGNRRDLDPIDKTIYLTFNDLEIMPAVWRSLLKI